ncbi:MAG: class I SAM-dependent methyltransferase [Pirellulaceae bacterium]|nr:class I SAM-dependent methyltransferase [Pirellulaceae bacterium]
MNIRNLLKKARNGCDLCLSTIGFKQSDRKIRSDAHKFWHNHSATDFGVNSHWKGCGIFSQDDDRWMSIGQRHLLMLQRMSFSLNGSLSSPSRFSSVLEWGCGGGANAVAFGGGADSFIAVDISQSSVDECLRQMKAHGMGNGTGIVVDIHQPEKVLSSVGQVDVVICTYVFEVLPSKTYATRLVRLFHDLLKPGGVALVQIRYATSRKSTQGRSWGYRFGFTKMVAFFLDEFWLLATQIGFRPGSIELVPNDETVIDERYAYFILEKPASID